MQQVVAQIPWRTNLMLMGKLNDFESLVWYAYKTIERGVYDLNLRIRSRGGSFMLNKAITLAAKAHDGQVDKGGNPYILHPLRVMMNCESETEKICAILHDVIEDTNITFEELKMEGFSDEIITVLDCLTKKEGESYDDFISRILPNKIACYVKLADLIDNMNLTRIQNPSKEDAVRIEKYKLAADRISDALPYAEAIPDCRLVEINGIAEIHPVISSDQFCDMFINFIESHGWFFGGGFKDITDEKQDY